MLGSVELPLTLLLWILVVVAVLAMSAVVLMVAVGLYEEHKSKKFREHRERVVKGER